MRVPGERLPADVTAVRPLVDVAGLGLTRVARVGHRQLRASLHRLRGWRGQRSEGRGHSAVFDNCFSARCGDDNFMTVF